MKSKPVSGITAAERIWMELEFPKVREVPAGTDAYYELQNQMADKRAALMSAMLEKLGYMPDYKGKRVFWHPGTRQRCYCITIDEAGGFYEMRDNGHWFNLDVFARTDAEKQADAQDE